MPTARKARTRAGEPAVEKKPPEPDDPEVGDGLGELVEVAPRIELLGVSEKWRTFDVGLAMASMARTRGDVGLYAATLYSCAHLAAGGALDGFLLQRSYRDMEDTEAEGRARALTVVGGTSHDLLVGRYPFEA